MGGPEAGQTENCFFIPELISTKLDKSAGFRKKGAARRKKGRGKIFRARPGGKGIAGKCSGPGPGEKGSAENVPGRPLKLKNRPFFPDAPGTSPSVGRYFPETSAQK